MYASPPTCLERPRPYRKQTVQARNLGAGKAFSSKLHLTLGLAARTHQRGIRRTRLVLEELHSGRGTEATLCAGHCSRRTYKTRAVMDRLWRWAHHLKRRRVRQCQKKIHAQAKGPTVITIAESEAVGHETLPKDAIHPSYPTFNLPAYRRWFSKQRTRKRSLGPILHAYCRFRGGLFQTKAVTIQR